MKIQATIQRLKESIEWECVGNSLQVDLAEIEDSYLKNESILENKNKIISFAPTHFWTVWNRILNFILH